MAHLVYEFDFVVGGGIIEHSGVFLETGIEPLFFGYKGKVELVKLNGGTRPRYIDARNGVEFLALGIRPGDMLRFRIEGDRSEAEGLAFKLRVVLC